MDEKHVDIVDSLIVSANSSSMIPAANAILVVKETKRMHEIMHKINAGNGTVADNGFDGKTWVGLCCVDCMCGLGQAAPAPVLTTLKHFKAEYAPKMN
jgi:NADH:ubiquinone oxidoreductase subunit F (NADH-binding)